MEWKQNTAVDQHSAAAVLQQQEEENMGQLRVKAIKNSGFRDIIQP